MSQIQSLPFSGVEDAGDMEWAAPNPSLGLAAITLAQGGGSQFLVRMLGLSADQLGADGAALLAHQDDECNILCSIGLPLSTGIRLGPAQFEQMMRSDGQLIENARSGPETCGWDFVKNAPFWQSIRPTRVQTMVQKIDVIAVFGSHSPTPPKTMRIDNANFNKLMIVLRDLFSLICEIADLSSRQMTVISAENVVRENDAQGEYNPFEEAPGVVERFLLETLISQPRVLARGNVSYHALNRWRKTVKNEQITALKSIKQSSNEAFENAIAEEISSWCRRAFGATAFSNVVAVPCGHSGEDCLSRRLGRKVAHFLDVQFDEAFNCLKVTGSSHPKTNTKRPKMKLKHVPVGPVLLIDDVATSGSHIEEAANALRKHDVAVISLAWIGSG